MHSSSVWVGRWGLGVFMGLWQSFGVAAKQTPLSFKPQCTIAETHILNTCWLIRFFLSQSTPPTPTPLAYVSFCLPTETKFNLEKKRTKGKLIALSELSHRPQPIGQNELFLSRKLWSNSVVNHKCSLTLSPRYLIISVEKQAAQWNEAWSYCKVSLIGIQHQQCHRTKKHETTTHRREGNIQERTGTFHREERISVAAGCLVVNKRIHVACHLIKICRGKIEWLQEHLSIFINSKHSRNLVPPVRSVRTGSATDKGWKQQSRSFR